MSNILNESSQNYIDRFMADCTLCPRNCHANRLTGSTGFCTQTAQITAARAALHMWEEPCISGSTGSGAVFFSGCNMKCVFCQNHDIASSEISKDISIDRLCAIYFELQAQNACNINLVTPTHFIPQIAASLQYARAHGLQIPMVYNTSGYESVDSLRLLDGLIDIYLPDCKYYSKELSTKYSSCPDYFEKVIPAIREMIRQTGSPVFFDQTSSKTMTASEYNDFIDQYEDDGDDYKGPLMKKGVIVRHLVLPGCTNNSTKVIQALLDHFGDSIYISIMSQYTPVQKSSLQKTHPELCRSITDEEYESVIDYAIDHGIENGFIQGSGVDSDSFIPAFNYTGL